MDPLLASSYPAWFFWMMLLQWVLPVGTGLAMIAWTLLFEKSEVRGTRLMSFGGWLMLLGILLNLVSFPFGGPFCLFTSLLRNL